MTTTIQATPVSLDSSPGSAPKWQMIAKAGEYRGYAGGSRSFTFDRALFRRIVENFRSHPSFDGRTGIVQWDVGHSSEVSPAEQTIEGAAAIGWVVDLDVRSGSEGAELWALTRWRPDMAEAIRAGGFQWASVAVVFDAVDPISGKNVGPMLTSVAATNKPFIEGMQPLAASAGYHRPQGRLMHDTIIRDYDGRNEPEKYLNFVRATKPDLPEHQKIVAAHELYKQHRPRAIAARIVRAGALLPEQQTPVSGPPAPGSVPGVRPTPSIDPPQTVQSRREEFAGKARQITPSLGNPAIDRKAAEYVAEMLEAIASSAYAGTSRENALRDLQTSWEVVLRDFAPAQRRSLVDKLMSFFDDEVAANAQTSAADIQDRRAAGLDRYPGANRVEQAIAMLRHEDPGFARLSWDQQVVQAGKVARASR